LLLLLLLLHLHLLHLLHHLRSHATTIRTLVLHLLHHHLLHHGIVGHPGHTLATTTTNISLRCHCLLHHGKVLLHALPILCHHLRAHAIRHAVLLTSLILLIVHVATTLIVSSNALKSIVLTSTAVELWTPALFFFAHIPPWLSTLHFDRLVQDR